MKLDHRWKGALAEVDEWWTGDADSPIVLLQNDLEEVERNSIYIGNALFSDCFHSKSAFESRSSLLDQIQIATLPNFLYQ